MKKLFASTPVRLFLTFLAGYALFELLSFYAYMHPPLSTMFFFMSVAAVAVLAAVRPGMAMLALFAELFVGSQGGYMFAYGQPQDGLQVSLRIGLFLAVIGVWAAKVLLGLISRDRARRDAALGWYRSLRGARLFWPYVVLLAAIAFGAVRGALMGNDLGNVFFDANGYAFLALLPAVIDAARTSSFRKGIVPLGIAAMVTSIAEALAVLYIFSHRMFDVASVIYVWIRDTRVGEITVQTGDFYRVFFQAHVFALAGVFGVLLFLVYGRGLRASKTARAAFAFAVWTFVALVLGLSRSFWFGGFAGAAVMFALLLRAHARWRVFGRIVLYGVVSVVAAIAVILAVYSVPFPSKSGKVALGSLLGERALSVGDAAANSRWALLPKLDAAAMRHPLLGSGLGTTVTYTTSDPRLLATNPTGRYTTFAFEWGYQDLWLKFGLLGLAAYAWFIAALLRPYLFVLRGERENLRTFEGPFTDKKTALIAVAAVSAIAALLGTHVFSPYLNHPLGFGIMFLAAAYAATSLPPLPIRKAPISA